MYVSTLRSNPSSAWQGGDNEQCQSYDIGNSGSWLGHPGRIALAPSGVRAVTRLNGLW